MPEPVAGAGIISGGSHNQNGGPPTGAQSGNIPYDIHCQLFASMPSTTADEANERLKTHAAVKVDFRFRREDAAALPAVHLVGCVL